MKKWIQFILMILGVGFLASLTLNFIKAKKNNSNEEGKNFKHDISINYYKDNGDNTTETLMFMNVSVVTDSEEEFEDFDSLYNYMITNGITEPRTFEDIDGNLPPQTVEVTYYLLPTTGRSEGLIDSETSGNILALYYMQDYGIFAIFEDPEGIDADIPFIMIPIIEGYNDFDELLILDFTDTVSKTNKELSQSMSYDAFESEYSR